uniref:helix-turn-helix domain-containing protein n=1 Tax=Enterobacter roggenkampii TaxID=1812935 RepID=UPI003D6DB65F
MTALAAEFFTLDEVNRLKIIQDVIDRRLTTQMAAQRLGISDRQCRRLLARYREDGPIGTVAKLAMRQPFVLFKGLTFQKLCLPGAFRPGDHHNK